MTTEPLETGVKEVKVSTYVEGGVLKVRVMRINRGNLENAECEAFNYDGMWQPVSIYSRDTVGVFDVPKGQSEAVATKILAAQINQAASYPSGVLIQVHWQNLDNCNETQMVAQGGDFTTVTEAREWVKEVVSNNECPEGWKPLVVDSTSEYFVWAAKPSEGMKDGSSETN